MTLSRFDVIGLSAGWFYIGVHIGAGNSSSTVIQGLFIGLCIATAILLIEG